VSKVAPLPYDDRTVYSVASFNRGVAQWLGRLPAVWGGGVRVALPRRHADRIRHVHLKDVRAGILARAAGGELDFGAAVAAGVFAPLGSGDVDLRGTLGALRDAGYDGWLVVEQDRVIGAADRPSAPRDDAARSFSYLKDALGGTA